MSLMCGSFESEEAQGANSLLVSVGGVGDALPRGDRRFTAPGSGLHTEDLRCYVLLDELVVCFCGELLR
jgi:hypothetical protein